MGVYWTQYKLDKRGRRNRLGRKDEHQIDREGRIMEARQDTQAKPQCRRHGTRSSP